MGNTVQDILNKLTLEEKASLCSGADFWNLKGLEHHGIPKVMVTDGPHGLRKQEESADHMEMNKSRPATCFATASALASSWDVDLLKEIGHTLGEECLQEQVAILLGPGVNIKRSPLCGRNFEYFSEDPYLSGILASHYIKGVQSCGIGTSIKHFAVNNQERRRMTIDVVVDERTLREIYLPAFEIAIKEAQPQTVMAAYNRLNGEYCSENSFLLIEILRNDWNFEGFVVSDWGATNERVKGLRAGLDLEMPGSMGVNDSLLVEAVQSGELNERILDNAVRRILTVILENANTLKDNYSYNLDSHHQLAYKAETESAVLLKNNGILPLGNHQKIAVIGEFAKVPRYQGSGSSMINPTRLDNAWDALLRRIGSEDILFYSPGYRVNSIEIDQNLIEEAVNCARDVDIVLLFAGLPDMSELEAIDRKDLSMPINHNALIDAVAEVNPNTVVVLSNGAPVTMPWINKVSAILESYLGGQAWGSAIVDLLFGIVNPSGKIAETFPRKIEDVAASVNFPGGNLSVRYVESIYVGYRWFDSANIEPLFPFGYGLSYTQFNYSDLAISENEGVVTVEFSITNSELREGKEIAQVYVKDIESTVFRPEKELKGFKKVRLLPGEKKTITIPLDHRAFAYWDSGMSDWIVESGEFEILIGSSSRDIRLREKYFVKSDDKPSEMIINLKQKIPTYFNPSNTVNFEAVSVLEEFSNLLGRSSPHLNRPPRAELNRTSSLEDMGSTLFGRIFKKLILLGTRKSMGKNPDERVLKMTETIVKEMPVRNLATFEGGLSLNSVDAILLIANRKRFKGILQLIRGRK